LVFPRLGKRSPDLTVQRSSITGQPHEVVGDLCSWMIGRGVGDTINLLGYLAMILASISILQLGAASQSLGRLLARLIP
jgi:hypothetical protein